MRNITLMLATLLLVACASPPVQQDLAANAKATSPIIVGTLATNACEAQTAALYTAAQVAVERGARYVRSGQLAPAQGDSLLAHGRSAKADLDAACARGVLDSTRLASAQAEVADMQTILGGVR